MVGLGDFFENGIGEEAFGFGRHAEGEVGVGAEGREGGDGNVLLLTITEESILAEVGMHLDLKDGGFDSRVGKDIADEAGGEIGDSDLFGESGIDEFFHGTPGVGVGDFNRGHGIASGGPAGRIHFGERDVFEGDGEVDEEEVELLEAKIGEGAFAGGPDVLGFVVGVPELAGDPEVVAAAESGIEGAGDTFADEGFISVVGGAVEMTVADFDGLMNNPGGEFYGDFPGAKTGRGEGGAIGKEVGGHCLCSLGNDRGLGLQKSHPPILVR